MFDVWAERSPASGKPRSKHEQSEMSGHFIASSKIARKATLKGFLRFLTPADTSEIWRFHAASIGSAADLIASSARTCRALQSASFFPSIESVVVVEIGMRLSARTDFPRRKICTESLLNVSAAIVLFAHQPFRWVFLDKTALIGGPSHAPLRFAAGLFRGPSADAAGALIPLAFATKASYAVDCAKPAHSMILMDHRCPGSGWFGCGTRTFLNIPSPLVCFPFREKENKIALVFFERTSCEDL